MTTDCPNGRDPAALPLEAVAAYPLPGMAIPGDIAFSPDDRLVTFLWSPERDLTRWLYAFDTASGARSALVTPPDGGATETTISLDEQLRRERARQRELGITQYAWAKRANRILVPLKGDLHVQDGPGAPLRTILDSQDDPALGPQLSPDGAWVAYVRDAELYLLAADGGAPRQLTAGARAPGTTNGLAEYIAQEEMHRYEGFWWSPDSRWIAFAQVDETHIPVYRIVHQGTDAAGEGAQEDHRYPFAGQPNARVRLGVVPIAPHPPASGQIDAPVWMDLGDDEDSYLARVCWLPDGGLVAQIENRAQTALDLVRFDPRTGKRRALLRETSDVWINLHDMFRPIARGPHAGGFIWASERAGFQHLYLYDRDGRLMRPLTGGDWMVDGLAGVDEERGLVYFTGTRDDPREKHLYVVALDGPARARETGSPRRITSAAGWHAVVVDHGCRRFVDIHDSLATPPTVTLRSLDDGAAIQTIYDERDPRLDALGLQPPRLVTVERADHAPLYGALYRPPQRLGAGPFPTIVYVYGGPHAQLVTQSWAMTINMRAQYLSGLGFLVFVLDNRGMARRGLAFEGAIKHDLGHVEVEDQAAGVRWLIAQGLADPARVGIYGWSYGGYMAAMCLARAPEIFKVAVAGAPVTHWDGYDTHYTERYMGTPQSNPLGYTQSSIMHHVDRIIGKLMLVHGLIDENVHFRHTARLINALIKVRKPYDLFLFPDERHMPRALADRIYMEERIRDYFLAHLRA